MPLTGLPAAAAVALAAASAACLVGLPPVGAVRLSALQVSERPHRSGPPDWFASAAAGLLLLVLTGPVPAVLGLLAVRLVQQVAAARHGAGARRDERRRAVEACAALAAELRAGRSVADALDVAAELATGPSADALRGAACAARLGGDVAGSLLLPLQPAGGSRTAVPEVLRALAACWTVCSTSGSGLACAVDRLGEGLRAEQERRRAVEAELAGPRATAVLLAVLPGAGFLLATGLGADPVAVLFGTPLGLVCLAAGLVLDGLGLLWTSRLVARAGGSG